MYATETAGAPLGADPSKLTDIQSSRLQLLESEDCQVAVERVTRKGIPPSDAEALRLEFLRFMALQHLTEQPLAPSHEVDEFWHAFILETQDYEAFCARHFGRFIHHFHDDYAASIYRETRVMVDQFFPGAATKLWDIESLGYPGGSRAR